MKQGHNEITPGIFGGDSLQIRESLAQEQRNDFFICITKICDLWYT